MNTDILFELVEQYDIITIYRHVSPDADALGAQFGLKQWIQETYPQKQVYALGRDAGSKQSLFPQMDVVPLLPSFWIRQTVPVWMMIAGVRRYVP